MRPIVNVIAHEDQFWPVASQFPTEISKENMRKDRCHAHFQKKEKRDKTVHRNLQKEKNLGKGRFRTFWTQTLLTYLNNECPFY